MQLGTRSLTLNLGGFERAAEVSDVRIIAEAMPAEERTLCGPVTRYRLRATAAQDPATDTLWDLAWDYVGDLVDVDLRPAGGDTISADQPSFTGTVEILQPLGDLLGGQANKSPNARFTFEIDWPFTAKPTRLTEGPA